MQSYGRLGILKNMQNIQHQNMQNIQHQNMQNIQHQNQHKWPINGEWSQQFLFNFDVF